MYPQSYVSPSVVRRSQGYYTHVKCHSCNNDVVKSKCTVLQVRNYVCNYIVWGIAS